MQILVRNVIQAESTELLKQATLETIGYICQDIDANILSTQSNEILTAIVNGMKKDEASDNVRLAATNALQNSLEFTKQNFENDEERHYIMQVVCEATQSPNTQIKVAALQCLVKIMSLYYQYMEYYMGPAMFAISLEAMKSEVEEVALQGIEFWSTVCDEEVDLAIEAQEAAERGEPPATSSKHYAKGALQYLVPILMENLTKQEEFDDEDEWNTCKAAGVSLMLLAQCVEDDVVPCVVPFVQENVKSANWRYRDAAVMTFGSILEGPDPATLKPLIERAMPVIIELLCDGSNVVRDSSAWTIGRVCETAPEVALQAQVLRPLIEALGAGLSAEPRVASNVCWAFSSLAEAAYDAAVVQLDEGAKPDTYCLSAYFSPIVEKLLATTNRPDAGQNNLRNAAYSAIMELLKSSPRDCYGVVQNTTLVVLERLQKVQELEQQVQTSSDRAQFNDLQSLLCATLQSVLRKIERSDAPRISDAVMQALLRMLHVPAENSAAVVTEQAGVHEDALLAVTALVEALGDDFFKYMEHLSPILIASLKHHQETQVCLNAIGLLGDLCRTLGAKMMPLCDEVFVILIEILSSQLVDKSIKPAIISVFGDVALALRKDFHKYLEVVMNTLRHASMAQVDTSDPDMVDYLNELRNAVLEAYTGIVQGYKDDSAAAVPGSSAAAAAAASLAAIQPCVPLMLSFVEQVAVDPLTTDDITASACGLVGDLLEAFGAPLLPMVTRDVFSSMIAKGRRSKVGNTRSLATWAMKGIRKLQNSQQP